MPLPSALTYGRVVGRFILAVADTNDADTEPDATPATGKVKFIPSASHVIVASGDPDPVFIAPQAIECTLDNDGYLRGPNNQPGVYLVASDNDAMSPRDWTYNVQFSIPGVQVASFALTVEGGVTKDLALVSPLPTTGGTTVVVSTESQMAAQAAAQDAQAAATLIAAHAPVLFLPVGAPVPSDAPDPCLIARY